MLIFLALSFFLLLLKTFWRRIIFSATQQQSAILRNKLKNLEILKNPKKYNPWDIDFIDEPAIPYDVPGVENSFVE